jgi:hypothetical protein
MRVILLCSFLLGGFYTTNAQSLQWSLVSPYPTAQTLNAATYGAGRFVAVGDAEALYSDDGGITWTEGAGFANEQYSTVAYGNGKFVAAAPSGGILTSSDGKTWTHHISSTPLGAVTTIAFGNGVFVLTAPNGKVGHSTDGEDWTFTTAGVRLTNGGQVVFGNGKFMVAEASSPAISFLASTDGTNWTEYLPTLPYLSRGYWESVRGITFANGVFVISAGIGGEFPGFGSLLRSTDGITFQGVEGPSDISTLFSLNESVVGFRGNSVYWSSNIVDWVPVNNSVGVLAGSYGGGHYVLVGSFGLVAQGSSLDTLQRLDNTNKSVFLDGVAASGSTIVGIQGWSTPLLITSTNNGRTYQSITPPDTSGLLYAISQTNGTFVAVGANGTVIRSTNGLNWSKRLSNTSSDLVDVTYGGGLWVAVGSGGKIITSSDASAFSLRNSGTEVILNSVIFDGSNYVVVGANGIILTSTNGVNWDMTGTDEALDLYSVAYGNGRYVVTGANGIVHTWTAGSARQTTTIPGISIPIVAYYKGRFVVLDRDTAKVFVSTDGMNWKDNPVPYGAQLGLDVSDGRLWVSGAKDPFVAGALIWQAVESPIAFSSATISGHFQASIDVTEPGNYRVYRSTNLDATGWQPLDLLNVSGHAEWTDADSPQTQAFYIIKREP